MKKRMITWALFLLCIAAYAEEFRTWTDRKGNTLEARLIFKSEKQIELRDKKGKIHRIDPEKLSDEDRLYLFPPPPDPKKYQLNMQRSSRQEFVPEGDDTDTTTVFLTYDYAMKIDFLTEDASHEGLRGAMLIVGSDPDGAFVVISKTEAPVEMVGRREGRVQAESFELSHTTDDDQEWIGGTKYCDYLFILYAQDGSVQEMKHTKNFLRDNFEKAFSLNIGDRFNKELELIGAGVP